REHADRGEPRLPLHERHDAGAVLRVAEDRIPLPVAEPRAVGRPGGALREMSLSRKAAPAIIPAIPFPEALVRIPQVMPARPTALLVPPHIAIGRLVTDREEVCAPGPPDDLLGAAGVPESGRHGRPVRRGDAGVPSRARAATVGV